jgi:hypothetical protein
MWVINKKEVSNLLQPLLIQCLKDEFDLTGVSENTSTPAAPGSTLVDTDEIKVDTDEQYTYCKGVGKRLHLTMFSRPEISNAVREETQFGGKSTPIQMKAMKYTIESSANT